MEYLNVLVAAIAGWAVGAVYYMVLQKPWLEAVGIETDENGKPVGESALPYIMSIICVIVVAGMMRHMFAMAGIVGVSKGLVAGLGVGAFFITPWIVINNAYGMRPFKLSIIDGGYAIGACAVIGVVLNLF